MEESESVLIFVVLFCLFFNFLLLDFFQYVRAGVKRLIATRKKLKTIQNK